MLIVGPLREPAGPSLDLAVYTYFVGLGSLTGPKPWCRGSQTFHAWTCRWESQLCHDQLSGLELCHLTSVSQFPYGLNNGT